MNNVNYASDVTVVGTGAMGTVIAKTLLRAGYRVTVWNRTSGRSRGLADEGAKVAESFVEAVNASPVTLLIVLDGSAVMDLLGTEARFDADWVLVNLTTVAADEAIQIGQWANEHGALYIDGGIIAYPRDIGRRETVILYSGSDQAFDRHKVLLHTLAGSHKFLGSAPDMAKKVYLAIWSQYFSALGGFFEAGALAHRAGLEWQSFANLLKATMLPAFENGICDAASRIDGQNFEGDQATIDTHAAGNTAMIGALTSAGLSARSISAFHAYVEAAQTAGLGLCDISAANLVIPMEPSA